MSNKLIKKWEDIKELFPKWDNVLIGNGFSTNIWDDYAYKSLRQESAKRKIEPVLTDEILQIFEAFSTDNYEEILKAVTVTSIVQKSLGHIDQLENLNKIYESVRKNLFNTVYAVHVPFDHLDKEAIAKELTRFRKVFTTCYDLIPYWSVWNSSYKDRMIDFLWDNNHFDITRTENFYPSTTTAFYYLHGALHLRKKLAGRVNKVRRSLVELPDADDFKYCENETIFPLFISEGSGKAKKEVIERDNYLGFCYKELSIIKDNLLIIGHSLDEIYDEHLLEAICKNSHLKRIAISIYFKNENDDNDILAEKIKIRLPRKVDIYFFDAKTHPLLNPKLKAKKQTETVKVQA